MDHELFFKLFYLFLQLPLFWLFYTTCQLWHQSVLTGLIWFILSFPPDRCGNNCLLICVYCIYFEVNKRAQQHIQKQMITAPLRYNSCMKRIIILRTITRVSYNKTFSAWERIIFSWSLLQIWVHIFVNYPILFLLSPVISLERLKDVTASGIQKSISKIWDLTPGLKVYWKIILY